MTSNYCDPALVPVPFLSPSPLPLAILLAIPFLSLCALSLSLLPLALPHAPSHTIVYLIIAKNISRAHLLLLSLSLSSTYGPIFSQVRSSAAPTLSYPTLPYPHSLALALTLTYSLGVFESLLSHSEMRKRLSLIVYRLFIARVSSLARRLSTAAAAARPSVEIFSVLLVVVVVSFK